MTNRGAAQDYVVDDLCRKLSFREKWTPKIFYILVIYFGVCIIGIIMFDTIFWSRETHSVTLIIGILGIWRYGWWFTHAVRSSIYGHLVYPKLRRRGQEVWAEGWRPRHLHFMMTTYKEDRDITEKVVRSVCREIRDSGVPGTIWLGSGDLFDEEIIESQLRREVADLDITLKIIRQNQPGKRLAIGLVLRAMNRSGIDPDDLIVFMDGDFILGEGAVRHCLPLFKVYRDLQAVTTDEEVLCIGPRWVSIWLTMRFAQRRLAMQSHALSGRVLTLTGRMSVFRAHHLLKLEFIRLLEADHLDNWLWGNFRFLSGDDKSTWYFILKSQGRMLYVPDALGYTVEIIEGGGLDRMVQNFRRWSGNMLRNGTRALALGPTKMPFFIWWCIVDQRISMWTMLVSPVLSICTSVLVDWRFIFGYIVFVAVMRMLLSLFLFGHSRRVHLSFPAVLYFNQLINASVKIYCLFRLSKQRWANRGDQAAGVSGTSIVFRLRNMMAGYLTLLYVSVLFGFVIFLSGLANAPSLVALRSLL